MDYLFLHLNVKRKSVSIEILGQVDLKVEGESEGSALLF